MLLLGKFFSVREIFGLIVWMQINWVKVMANSFSSLAGLSIFIRPQQSSSSIYPSVCFFVCLFVCPSFCLFNRYRPLSLSLLSTCLFFVFLNFHLCSAFYSKCMSAYLLTFSCLFLSLRSLFYLHQLFLDSYLFLDSSAFNFLAFSFSLFLYLAILDNLFISLPRHYLLISICLFLNLCASVYQMISGKVKDMLWRLQICEYRVFLV
jgi:hypothetical protein